MNYVKKKGEKVRLNKQRVNFYIVWEQKKFIIWPLSLVSMCTSTEIEGA